MSDYLGWRQKKAPAEFRARFDKEIIPGGPMTHSYEDYVKNIFQSSRPTPPEPSKSGSNITQNQTASDFKDTFETGYGIPPLTSEPPPDYSISVGEDKYFSRTETGGLPSNTPHLISATKMLQMEQEYGKDAIDDSSTWHQLHLNLNFPFLDDATFVDKSPLEQMYDELGINGMNHKNYKDYKQFQVYEPKSTPEYFNTMYNISTPSTGVASSRDTTRSHIDKDNESWKKTDRQYLVDYKNFNRYI